MLKSIKYIVFYVIFMILLFSLSVLAADPDLIVINEGAWQKVATNVTTGQIHIATTKPDGYFQTYRITGNPAPTLQDEGIYIPWGTTQIISSAAGIDVYIYCKGSNGKIRLDL